MGVWRTRPTIVGKTPRAVPVPLAQAIDLPRAEREDPTGDPIAGTRVGRYILLSQIGAGGMGTVFKAVDPVLDRAVAVKMVHASSSARGRAALMREAQALAKLSHPNVVPIFDVGTVGNAVFLAMELVRGQTVSEWLKTAPTRKQVLEVFSAAGRGLAAAHSAGLVHRDFKPANIMIGDDGRVRVLDFGLARQASAGEEMPLAEGSQAGVPLPVPVTSVAGTPTYMAPEQAVGSEVDARTDVFAFCVAVHEAIYGELPFPEPHLDEDMTRYVAQRRVGSAPAEARDRLYRVLRRGLSPEPMERYSTMAPLLAELSRPSLAERLRQTATLVVLLMAAVAVTAVVHTLWQRHLANEKALAQAAQIQIESERAQREARRARDSTRLAMARELARDPTLVIALIREVEEPTQQRAWPSLAAMAMHSQVALAVLQHDDGVWTGEFSPDGQHVATAYGDKARVWRADGRGTPVTLSGHAGPVWRATFSPDGRRVLTVSFDHTARIWNADGSGTPIVLEHPQKLSWAAFSPDGQRVATVGWDHIVRLWNSDGTGTPILFLGHTERVRSVAFSPDGQRLVTGSVDNTARVWNVDVSGRSIELKGHEGAINQVAFSPDGTRVVSASDDGSARVWRADGSGSPIVLPGSKEEPVRTAAFSPDGKRVAVGGSDGIVRVWSADGSGKPIEYDGHAGKIMSVAFDPAGRHVLAATAGGQALLWRVDGGPWPLVLAAASTHVWTAAFNRDGTRIVTAGGSEARIWSVRDRNAPVTYQVGPPDPRVGMVFSPDGRQVAVAPRGSSEVQILRTDRADVPLILHGHSAAIADIEFSPDGHRLATASYDGTVRIWSVRGEMAPIVLDHHGTPVASVTFSPDGRRIATFIWNHTGTAIEVWNADGSGQPTTLSRGRIEPTAPIFSSDGSLVAAGFEDGTVEVWRADGSGNPRVLRGHQGKVLVLAFSPAGDRLATAAEDERTAWVWNLASPGPPLVLEHPHQVRRLQFSSDGQRLLTVVSVPNGLEVRIWNVDGSGQPSVFPIQSPPSIDQRLSQDGTRVLVTSAEAIQVWNADGSGVPIVLGVDNDMFSNSTFSANGMRVAAGVRDGTVRIWSNLTYMPSISDLEALLWKEPAFCMSMAKRRELLGFSEETARDNLALCQARVGAPTDDQGD